MFFGMVKDVEIKNNIIKALCIKKKKKTRMNENILDTHDVISVP